MSLPRAESEYAYQIILMMTILSSCAGVMLAYWMRAQPDSIAYLLFGCSHAIIFVPAMVVSKTSPWKMVLFGLLCIAFPFWNTFVGLFTAAIGAPFVSSLIWGCVVAFAIRREQAVAVFSVIGLLTTFALLGFMNSRSLSMSEGGFAETVAVWYILVGFAFPYLQRCPIKGSGEIDPDFCEHCGYSLVGLPETSSCPECGNHPHKKSDPEAAD